MSAIPAELGPFSAGLAPSAGALVVPPPTRYGLPADYVQRAPSGLDQPSARAYWTPERVANTARYQAHVYHWADRIAADLGLRRVLDVGCGVGVKLARMLSRPGRELLGIDQASAVEVAARIAPGPVYFATDLEDPLLPRESGLSVVPDAFDLVVCADVIEHLADPDPLMAFVRRVLAPSGVVVLSTPDRDRLRGRGCRHSPKPDHVREWARDEFAAFVRSRGFVVCASRLVPQDDAPLAESRGAELRFRLGQASTSPRACHALLCRVAEQGVIRA